MESLRKLAGVGRRDSFSGRMRRQRFALFESIIEPLGRPLRILDVGGTESFWEVMGFVDEPGVEVTLLNLDETGVRHPNFTSLAGDARDLSRFRDDEFDVVFSNSVIEHVGGRRDQLLMAKEIARVGKCYFVQTPNLYFPVEPHFLFPLFQFLPLAVKVALIRNFDLGFSARGGIKDKAEAESVAGSIELLSRQNMRDLFPNATIYEEKFFGLNKSFIAYRR